jgi:hypothetical protein
MAEHVQLCRCHEFAGCLARLLRPQPAVLVLKYTLIPIAAASILVAIASSSVA